METICELGIFIYYGGFLNKLIAHYNNAFILFLLINELVIELSSLPFNGEFSVINQNANAT